MMTCDVRVLGLFDNLNAPDAKKKEVTFLLVNAEAINDKPVTDKYLTPQAIALCCLYF
jgi:hypothetical protein